MVNGMCLQDEQGLSKPNSEMEQEQDGQDPETGRENDDQGVETGVDQDGEASATPTAEACLKEVR